RLCGGVNVFAELPALAPTVSTEAVLAENPDVIIAGGMGERNAAWLEPWKKWPRLKATARGNLFFIDPNLLQRHTPRQLEGAEALCAKLEEARNRHGSSFRAELVEARYEKRGICISTARVGSSSRKPSSFLVMRQERNQRTAPRRLAGYAGAFAPGSEPEGEASHQTEFYHSSPGIAFTPSL